MGIPNYNMFEQPTARGHRFDECTSAMQKAIRRGDVKIASYFAMELTLSGYPGYVWKRLLTITAEDCWGCITHEVLALQDAWKQVKKNKDPKKGRLFITKAIILLCHVVKHNRDADLLNNIFYDQKKIPEEKIHKALQEAQDGICDVPDYAIDCHTKKGKRQGKTKRQFFREEQLSLFNEHPTQLK